MSGESASDPVRDPDAARESLRRIATSDLPYAEYARRALAELDDESENGTGDTEGEIAENVDE